MTTPGVTTPDDERFARLLTRVLEEGLDPASEEARELMAGLEQPGERLDEARRVVALLERAARERRAELDEARAPDERARELARAFVAERMRGGRPRRGWRAPLVAAAALALVALGWWLRDEPRPQPDVLMGGRIELVEPFGGGAAYARFAWSYDLAPGGWFLVLVSDPHAADPGAEELARSPRLSQPEWSPSASTTASWPDRVQVEVRAYDAVGDLEADALVVVPRGGSR